MVPNNHGGSNGRVQHELALREVSQNRPFRTHKRSFATTYGQHPMPPSPVPAALPQRSKEVAAAGPPLIPPRCDRNPHRTRLLAPNCVRAVPPYRPTTCRWRNPTSVGSPSGERLLTREPPEPVLPRSLLTGAFSNGRVLRGGRCTALPVMSSGYMGGYLPPRTPGDPGVHPARLLTEVFAAESRGVPGRDGGVSGQYVGLRAR